MDEKPKASLLATGNSFPGRKSLPDLPKFLPDFFHIINESSDNCLSATDFNFFKCCIENTW